MMTDILFNGYYGKLNTGDDAFVEVTSYASKKIWRKDNVRYLAPTNSLPKTEIEAKGYFFNFPKSFSLQQNYLLRNSEYFITAGGSTLNKSVENTLRGRALSRKKSHGALKLGAIGVSIGPFKSSKDEKSIIEYLKGIDFLALRDMSSYEYACSLELDYLPIRAFDLAAMLPDIYGPTSYNNNEIRTIGISLCNYESYIGGDLQNEKRRNGFVTELLQTIERIDNIRLKFFVFNGHSVLGDENVTYETISKLLHKDRIEVINYSKSTKDTWNAISHCDALISTRLHASVFACFAKIPFFLIEYHKKCTDFLKDIGYAESQRIFDGESEINQLASKIVTIANNNSSYLFPTKMEDMKELAYNNFNKITL